jgi:hypothetical protein
MKPDDDETSRARTAALLWVATFLLGLIMMRLLHLLVING